MANSDTSSEDLAFEPATELHNSEPLADSAMADLPAPPPISEVVEETLDAVDRELATLEAALKGELKPVTAFPQESMSLPESFRAETAVDQEGPAEPADVLSDSDDLAAAEQTLEKIASSMAVAVGTEEATSPEATMPLANEELVEENPAPATADWQSSPETAAVAAEEALDAESPETVVIEMSDVAASLSATEAVEPISEGAPVKVSQTRKLVTVAALPLRAALCVLIVVDWPFSRLSPRLKNLLGYAGIATSVVAAATWAAAGHLKH